MSGVVVTGAASGIGRASAEALVADGRKVALGDFGALTVAERPVVSRDIVDTYVSGHR
ncbi:MAG TPA: hypothetical protein VHJ79_00855 [Mycobacterium sp.]|nr:hypothetical protein [Mycobacterium sp.]